MSVHRNIGDALEGERIACQGRKMSKPRLISMTQGHRGTALILSGNVYCIIETPMIRTA